MKYSIYMSLLLGLVLAAGSCDKQYEVCPEYTDRQEHAEDTVRIHYSTTVSGGDTKASVDGSTKYVFENGDRLFIESGDDMYGALYLVSGIGEASAVFEGDLICLNGFMPEDATVVTGKLVSLENELHTTSEGKITATAYPDQYASSFADAVRKYGNFTASGIFGTRSLTLAQQSTFLIFDLTFDGEQLTDGQTISATLTNGETTLRDADVELSVEDGVARANFVSAFNGDEITLSSASISINGNEFSIGAATLAANTYYKINRANVLYGDVEVILPPTTNYTLGSQAFPVRVSLDEDATDKYKLTGIQMVAKTPNDSEIITDIPISDLLSQGYSDLDADDFLSKILTAEGGVTSLPTGDYVFYLKLTYNNEEHVKAISATMSVLASDYYNTAKWDFTVGALSTNDYLELKMTADNSSKQLQNIAGFGVIIEGSWNQLDGAMFYYPVSLNGNMLRLQGRHVGSDAIPMIDKTFNPSNHSLVLRFCQSGIYWNTDNDSEEDYTADKNFSDSQTATYLSNMVSWCTSENLKIGSREGNNRSYATYDYIRAVRY